MRRLSLLFLALLLGACADNPRITAPDDSLPARVLAEGGAVLEIKFVEALEVRLDADGRLYSARGTTLTGLHAALHQAGVRTVRPLFTGEPSRLAALRARARAGGQDSVPDLEAWYRITLPPAANVDAVVAALSARPEVTIVYPAPEPAPPPGAFSTPNFVASQANYFGPAPSGTETVYVRSLAGGRGAGVRIVDLEYDWHFGHEDLLLSSSILIAGQRYTVFGSDHGTAVLGILAARDNLFGITGGVPDAIVRVAGAVNNGSYEPANAITNAAAQLSPGDVILIEQQAKGPSADTMYIPLEWIVSVYDAIRLASLSGIVVVQAAGNGGRNLDATLYNNRFNRNYYNSGAIIVGAGNASNARLAFSSYGSRVDVQAHGESVTTTGYGGLWGSTLDDRYTGSFSGTSSASAIVAASVVALQGYQGHRGRPRLSPAAMSSLLKTTGSAQTGSTWQNIGPKPNLRAAVEQLDAPPPPALTAGIYGADEVPFSTWCYYSGWANGGVPPYSFGWISVGGLDDEWWSGNQYGILTSSGGMSIEMWMTVRDAAGQYVEVVKYIGKSSYASC
jgi:serine protease